MVAEAAERETDHEYGPGTPVRVWSDVSNNGTHVRPRFFVAAKVEEHRAKQVVRPPLVAARNQTRLELTDGRKAALEGRSVRLVTVEGDVCHHLDLGDQGSIKDLVGTQPSRQI